MKRPSFFYRIYKLTYFRIASAKLSLVRNERYEPEQVLVIETTAPLFFRLVDAVRAQEGGHHDAYFFLGSKEATEVHVCALSGHMPTKHCPRTVVTQFIAGVSPIKLCEIHREVNVMKKTGLRACSSISGERTARVYEFWPSDLLTLFEKAGIGRRVPPPYDPKCSITAEANLGRPPEITSLENILLIRFRSTSYHLE